MPLVRYEVRCEHSLANPELYRTAGQDDSEGLLEGVAMAGLVGIVRQLGDLAEFAAEIFHDLHDDILAVVARGRSLKARVARLEADLPAVEKALLAESSQFNFAYSGRCTWRAPVPMDLNLCAQGELPRFVRSFYDDCRGPPRLFLLDKFDEAGRGACVKRYTDPTFFRISWAASVLSKAEKLRREREAELQKKSTAGGRGAEDSGPKIYARERLSSALFENLEGFTGDFTPELLRSRRLDRVFELPSEGALTPDSPRSPLSPRSPQKPSPTWKPNPVGPQVSAGPVLAPLKLSTHSGRRALSEASVSSDDAEFFADALTTMGSDPDSEPGSRTRWEADSVHSRLASSEFASEGELLNHSVLKAHVEARRFTPPRGPHDDDYDDVGDESFARRLLGSVGGGGIAPGVAGFDTVRGWEDDDGGGSADGSIELASVVDDSDTGLAMVVAKNVVQEESLSSDPPDEPPDALSDKPPDTRASAPVALPDAVSAPLSAEVSDTASDKPPYQHPEDEELGAVVLSPKLSDKQSDRVLLKLPSKRPAASVPPSGLSQKTPSKRAGAKPGSTPPSAGRSEKLSARTTPHKPAPKVSPQKPSYQSHDSVSLLDSFRPSVRVKPIVASIEARAHSLAVESAKAPPSPPSPQGGSEEPKLQPSSPATTPRSRRLWGKANAPQVHSSILQLAGMERREPSDGDSELSNARASFPQEDASHPDHRASGLAGFEPKSRRPSCDASSPSTNASTSSTVAEDDEDEGYSSSARSSPKGLPNFCALLSPSQSPPRVAEGLMGPPSLFLGSSYFQRKIPRAPPVTPFLSDSPSVSRTPSLNVQPSVSVAASFSPGHVLLRSPVATEIPAHDSDKTVPVTSPRSAGENGYLELEPRRTQAFSLPNPVPRPRTWVGRSESSVAATLRAIRQAAAVGSDDDTGSECRSDC